MTTSGENTPAQPELEATEASDGPGAQLPSHGPDGMPLIGTMLGNFRIAAILGEGSFGRVYKAIDTQLQRDVAIKYLKDTEEAFHGELFAREAKALAALSKHPRIVTIHQWGKDNDHPYFVLEFVDASVTDAMEEDGGLLDLREALRITADCADALYAAHEQKILHRDIKPANILLEGPNRDVRLADFGLARIGAPSPLNTVLGGGSPAYMSPEQAQIQDLDHRSDIFSLGVSLYQLITGERMFEGDTAQSTKFNIVNDVRIPLKQRQADLPDLVYQIVDKATANLVKDRYSTAREFEQALRTAMDVFDGAEDKGTVSATKSTWADFAPVGHSSKASPATNPSRRVLLGALIGGTFLLLAVFLGYSLLSGDATYPSRSDSKSPERILRYFCEQWARENYVGMYAALYDVKQDETSFAEWKALVQKETQRVSVPKTYELEGPIEDYGDRTLWKVMITYSNTAVGTLTKTTWVVKGADGWRIGRGGLIGIVQNQFGPNNSTNDRTNTFGPS